MLTREAQAPPGFSAVRTFAAARAVPWAAVLGVPLGAVLFTLASPPYDRAPLGWLSPAVLVWALRGLRPRAAAGAGFVFGMLSGWGITGWVVGAALRYFDADPVRAGAVGLVLWVWCGGAGFAAFAWAWARWAERMPWALRPLFAAWCWVAMEWVRATAFTGLPWALLAHTQYRHPALMQIADLGGAYAVSFVMVAVGVGLAEALAAGSLRRRATALAVPAALLGATVLYAQRPGLPHDGTARRLVLVQGNVENELRWNRTFFARTLGTYARLSLGAMTPAPDLVIWPENAVDLYLDAEPAVVPMLRAVAARAQGGLLFGGPRLAAPGQARNAVHLMAPDGAVASVHDKQHLVPFAEYVPWAVAGPDDEPVYGPGADARPVVAGGARLGIVTCIEAIYAPLVRRLAAQDVGILVNVANDAWLDAGDGGALWQHFAATVFRAVETRRPLVRAASTGVTAVVQADGTVTDVLPLREPGALVADVRASHGTSPYVRFGDAWIGFAGLGFAALLLRRRRTA